MGWGKDSLIHDPPSTTINYMAKARGSSRLRKRRYDRVREQMIRLLIENILDNTEPKG